MLEIDANLREATPVDTGHARANWVPSVGAPVLTEEPGTNTSEHDAGLAGVLRFKIGDGDLYETNNVPYINMLDLGHSKQAPVGFVAAAVDAAQTTIQSAYNGVQIDLSSNVATAPVTPRSGT